MAAKSSNNNKESDVTTSNYFKESDVTTSIQKKERSSADIPTIEFTIFNICLSILLYAAQASAIFIYIIKSNENKIILC